MSLKKVKDTRKKALLSEGFLDGDEDVVKTADAAEPEVEETEGDDETDISDEGGEGDEDLDSDGDGEADEYEGDSEDSDAGVEEEEPEEEQDLKDTMQSLITAVQALTDKIEKQNSGDSEEGGEEASEDDDFGGEEETADETADEDSDFEGDEESSDEESSEEESSDEESSDDSDEESSDDGETSEAYRFYSKPGRQLSEKSNYMIGKIASGRIDKLEEAIIAIAKSKIKQRIEGAKKEYRARIFTAKFGE